MNTPPGGPLLPAFTRISGRLSHSMPTEWSPGVTRMAGDGGTLCGSPQRTTVSLRLIPVQASQSASVHMHVPGRNTWVRLPGGSLTSLANLNGQLGSNVNVVSNGTSIQTSWPFTPLRPVDQKLASGPVSSGSRLTSVPL